MPEGDAVARAARRLDTALAGQLIAASDFRIPAHATANLAGQRVLGVRSVGKHLLLRTDAGLTLHSQLRMQGRWVVLGSGRRLPSAVVDHVRLLLRLVDGRSAVALDMPVLELLPTAREVDVIGHLGPDLLGADFDVEVAARNLARVADRPVIAAVLDQRNVAGAGNVWAVESLFLTGLDPWRAAGTVDTVALAGLLRRLLLSGFNHPGMVTTGDPRPGRTHWVYGRAGRPCRRCGTPIALRRALADRIGRGRAPVVSAAEAAGERETWWCPACQPARRLTGDRPGG